MLNQKFQEIQSRIQAAAKRANRDPSKVKLIAATKYVDAKAIQQAISLGIEHIGENRVQDASKKKKELSSENVTWHMIGHLQTNKVKEAVQVFDWIHSVDSLRLAEKINRECEKINKIMPILIEVNTSKEKNKYGVAPEELSDLATQIKLFSNIQLKGLMTMAPIVEDLEQTRPYFRQLHESCSILSSGSFELSMGMSQDFEVAIEEGATFIRLGTLLFESI